MNNKKYTNHGENPYFGSHENPYRGINFRTAQNDFRVTMFGHDLGIWNTLAEAVQARTEWEAQHAGAAA